MAGVIVQASTVLSTRDTTMPNLDSRRRACKQGCSSAIVENSRGRQAFPRRSSHFKSKWLTASSPWIGTSVKSAKDVSALVPSRIVLVYAFLHMIHHYLVLNDLCQKSPALTELES